MSETQRGKVTFYPSGLYREWRAAVRAGREAYQASFRERMDRHAAEVVAAVAKVRGNPNRPAAYVEDQWAKPTPSIVYMTSPALRELQKPKGNPRGPARRRPPKTVPFNPRATRRRNPSAIPIASGLIVNPVPTNDYRSAATRESTPLHIWWSNVLDLAGVTHAQSLPHRSQVNRWYQAGEPAWMAADGLRLLARKNQVPPRRNPAPACPVIKRFTYLGTSDEVDACDCCGKSDLKRTVAIQDNDSGETLYFGTTCAARALKQTVKEVKAGTAVADRAKAEAEQARRRAASAAYEKEWHAYLADTGALVRETYGPREWVGDNVTGRYQYQINVYETLQRLGGMKAAREGFDAWKIRQAKQNPRRRA